MASRIGPPVFQNLEFEPVVAKASDVILLPATARIPGNDYGYPVRMADYKAGRHFHRRVQDIAKNYLQGHNIFIQTAVLKGPLEQGWVNPYWQDMENATGRKRKSNPGLTTSLEQSKIRRAKERQLRDQRAQALQADGCGKSSTLPVDLTEDVHDCLRAAVECKETPRADLNMNFEDHGVSLDDGCQDNSLPTDHKSVPETAGLELNAISPEKPITTKAPSPNSLQPPTANSRQNTIERTENEEIAVQPLHTDKEYTALDGEVEIMVYDDNIHSILLIPSTKQPPLTSKDTENELQSPPNEHHKNQARMFLHTLPTPSDSGNERQIAAFSPLPETPTYEIPSTAPGVLQSSGFTAINRPNTRALSESRRRPLFDKLDDMDSEPIDGPQLETPDWAGIQGKKPTNLASRIRSTTAKGGRRCLECGTQDTPTWRRGPKGLGTLCRKCGQREYSRLRRKKPVKHQPQGPTTTNPPSTAVVGPKLTPDLATSHSLSQPTPSTLQHHELLSFIRTPSSTFPQDNHTMAPISHVKIFREMFPSGALKDATNDDQHLFALMGKRFKPEWDPIVRSSKIKHITSLEHAPITPANRPTTLGRRPKQPRLMTFDTPVVARALRSTHRAVEKRDATSTIENPSAGLPQEATEGVHLTTNTAVQQADKEIAATDVTEHGAADDFDVNTNSNTRVITNLELLDNHANSLLSTEQISPLRDLAHEPVTNCEATPGLLLNAGKSSHGDASQEGVLQGSAMQEDKLVDKQEDKLQEDTFHEAVVQENIVQDEALHDITVLHEANRAEQVNAWSMNSPYVSTQAAMLEAHYAFQEALSSPSKASPLAIDEGSTTIHCDDDHMDDMSPPHVAFGIDSEVPGNDLNTQAIFDAFVFESPPASQLSTAEEVSTRKHASFAQTPLGPKEANTDVRLASSKKKGCLKRITRQSITSKSMLKSREITTLSNLGLSQENSASNDDMGQYIEQAESFLGDWNIDISRDGV